jgi:hypothetical protein
MAVKIKDVDKGWRSLLKRVDAMGTTGLSVGVHEEEGGAEYSDGATVAEVATYNEFGTERIPERSFLRTWYDENKEQALIDARKLFAYITRKGGSLRNGLDQLGLRFVGQIQTRISSGIPPENADSTIRQKGSSVPLIATGQLRASVRHKVS